MAENKQAMSIKQALRVMVNSEYYEVDDDTFELIYDAYINSPHIMTFSQEMGDIIDNILFQRDNLDAAFEEQEQIDAEYDANEVYLTLSNNQQILYTPYKN